MPPGQLRSFQEVREYGQQREMLDSIDTIVNTILQQDDKVDIDFNTVDPGSVAVYKMPHTFDSEDVDSNPVKREGSITGVATAKGQEVTNAEFTYPMFTLGGDELPRKVVIRQEHDSKIYLGLSKEVGDGGDRFPG